MKDHFQKRAQTWDSGNIRVAGAQKIADAIRATHKLHKDMEILDFGVGTGLLGFEIAKDVKQVYGIDTSKDMLERLQEKNTQELYIETFHQDIMQTPLEQKFDGIISSMTLHHIQDTKKFFHIIYDLLNDDGFIAIADLELEDGTFHSDNAGVHHFGFDTKKLCKIVEDVGFKEVVCKNINTIQKPHKEFGIFLLSAKK